jgi:hypothetical protein
MRKLKLSLILLISPFLFWQCTDEADQLDSFTLSGSAIKGPVVEATVIVYSINEAGERGDVVATTVTNQHGNFKVEVDAMGFVEVVIHGGSYQDEASGQQVSLEMNELRTIIEVDGDENFGITALTTIAAEYINENAESGLSIAIENANKEVADLFGLSGIDINTTIPANLPSIASQNMEMAQIKYGAVQAGLSQLLHNHGYEPEDLLDLIEDFGKDFVDGIIDGKNGSEALNFVLGITPVNAIDGLQTAMESFMNGTQNSSGFMLADMDF